MPLDRASVELVTAAAVSLSRLFSARELDSCSEMTMQVEEHSRTVDPVSSKA